MNIIDIFEHFAAEFEAAVDDDNWSRLARYFASDATYRNVGGPDPACTGPDAILACLKKDVSEFDRRFDKRTLVALTPPRPEGNRLSRRWRCIYSVAGAPDLVVEGEARYLFEGGLVRGIEQEPTTDSMRRLEQWMAAYADKLRG